MNKMKKIILTLLMVLTLAFTATSCTVNVSDPDTTLADQIKSLEEQIKDLQD